MVVLGEALECREAALEQRAAQWRAQIRLDLCGRLRQRALEFDERAHPDIEWRVLAGEIRRGIEGVDVERRVSERRLRGFQPEKIAIDARDEAIAFKALIGAQSGVLERHGARALRVQICDLMSNRSRTAIGQLTVKLVTPDVHGKGRLGLEIGLEKLITIPRPAVVGSGCRSGAGRRRRCWSARTAGERSHHKQHQRCGST